MPAYCLIGIEYRTCDDDNVTSAVYKRCFAGHHISLPRDEQTIASPVQQPYDIVRISRQKVRISTVALMISSRLPLQRRATQRTTIIITHVYYGVRYVVRLHSYDNCLPACASPQVVFDRRRRAATVTRSEGGDVSETR